MKKFREIKWSEIARRSIEEKVNELKGITKGSDLFKSLPEETKKGIEEISKFTKSDWKKYYKKMREKTRKRAKLLIQAS